ncbi:hypothetical protein PIB30_000997 [Stylosanthes scabra]|uniref:Uncharacterized protein n=1 Tax=Stylosanthes scabra TaxID=79078 RepID=A0ABU6T4A3_9FABA|nr:hypothetical protein [Stylosanthes scabra]
MEWWMVPKKGDGTIDDEEGKRTMTLNGNARGGNPNTKLKTAMQRKKATTVATAEARNLKGTVTGHNCKYHRGNEETPINASSPSLSPIQILKFEIQFELKRAKQIVATNSEERFKATWITVGYAPCGD